MGNLNKNIQLILEFFKAPFLVLHFSYYYTLMTFLMIFVILLTLLMILLSMKFLPPEVALYLCKCTIRPCMEYWCHVWAGAPSCYLELLDKVQKRICRTIVPPHATSLEPLVHCRNAASLSLFCRYYFGRCSSELAQLDPLHFSRGRSTRYSHRSHGFSVTIPRCYKDVYVSSFFPHTARLWNYLPMECFPFTNDLNNFNSRINRHSLTVASF